jgi:hypothetical protein
MQAAQRYGFDMAPRPTGVSQMTHLTSGNDGATEITSRRGKLYSEKQPPPRHKIGLKIADQAEWHTLGMINAEIIDLWKKN